MRFYKASLVSTIVDIAKALEDDVARQRGNEDPRKQRGLDSDIDQQNKQQEFVVVDKRSDIMIPTDDQIKSVAAQAARKRWDIESWQFPTWTDFKQTAPDRWQLTYNEPDTGTPEEIRVQLINDTLHAYAWSSLTPVIYKL